MKIGKLRDLDLVNLQSIRNILAKYGLRPNKRLGQHFLLSRNVLNSVVGAADLKSKDIVLEIGPGIGTLTQELAKKAKKVIAAEKDPKMCEILKETLQGFDNIEVIRSDILKLFQVSGPKFQKYKVVANLPYYITAPVIRMFLEGPMKALGVPSLDWNKPELMVLMVQKEVAQRITAQPSHPKGARLAPQHGAAKMSLLAVSAQFYAKPEIVSYVPKTAFWPQPKVDSAILKITPIDTNRNTNPHEFFKLVKAGFSHPRKQIIGNLSKGLNIERGEIKIWLKNSGIRPEQRAESLGIENWIKLTMNYAVEISGGRTS